jgi:hypothetical protein
LFIDQGGKARIEADPGVRGKLAVIMSYHVVKPLSGYEAWTTPFLSPGTTLETFSNAATITVANSDSAEGGGVVKLQGSDGSADIVRKDIHACKVTETVLLPDLHAAAVAAVAALQCFDLGCKRSHKGTRALYCTY